MRRIKVWGSNALRLARTFKQLTPNAQTVFFMMVACSIVLPLVIIGEITADPAAEQDITSSEPSYVIIAGTKVTSAKILTIALLSMVVIVWGFVLAAILHRQHPGSIYNSYIFSSRIKWLMRIGILNACMRGWIAGVTIFTISILSIVMMGDITSLLLGPDVAEHVAGNVREGANSLIGICAVFAIIAGTVIILEYIVRECSVIAANKRQPPPQNPGFIFVSARLPCLVVGIPCTMFLLLLRPSYLKGGLLTARGLLTRDIGAIRHPLKALTRTYKENQLLADMYPDDYEKP